MIKRLVKHSEKKHIYILKQWRNEDTSHKSHGLFCPSHQVDKVLMFATWKQMSFSKYKGEWWKTRKVK